MAIPYASTRIQVLRAEKTIESDGYEAKSEEAFQKVGTPVRAHISVPGTSGLQRVVEQFGDATRVRLGIVCDPVDVESGDLIEDLETGKRYDVDWAHPHGGPIPHVKGYVLARERN